MATFATLRFYLHLKLIYNGHKLVYSLKIKMRSKGKGMKRLILCNFKFLINILTLNIIYIYVRNSLIFYYILYKYT